MNQKKTNWMNRVKLCLAVFVLVLGFGNSLQAEAATEAQKEAFKQELLDIFMKQDNTARDISKYNISRIEFYEEYKEFQKEEGLMIYSAYPHNPDYSLTGTWYLKTFTLECTDAKVLSRYEKMCTAVEEIRAGIEPEMTDLDKILYLHDCVVERTSYGGSGDQIYVAGGALGDGRAVCMGYAYALNMLLKLEGFEQSYARSESLSHGWTYVKLDEEWYHIDPTWDDTRSPKSGQTSRIHFMKNDTEFKMNHGSDLYAVDTSEASTSTKYSSWFLRDIVGKMCFEDGLWYYYDEKTDMIMEVSLDGTVENAVIDCGAWAGESILDVTDNVVTMMANGYSHSIEIGDGCVVPEEDSSISALPSLDDIQLNDFSNWISGTYHYQTGAYTVDTARLALDSYVTCSAGTEYHVTVSDSRYQVLIRELSSSQYVLASHNLKSADSFTTNVATKYLAVSIYAPSISGLTYDAYESLFANGFCVEISSSALEEGIVESEGDDSSVTEDAESALKEGIVELSAVNFCDADNWMSGMYHYQTGLYVADGSRICLKNYVLCEPGKEYTVAISNGQHNVLIREMDASLSMLVSHNLSDGSSFTTRDNTQYLAVSIYAPHVSGMTYEKYVALFEEGMTLYIADEEIDEEVAPDTDYKDESATEVATVENWDFRDFSNWQTGMYHYSNGLYCTYNERICLTEYLEYASDSYVANITNATYKLLVRELDQNHCFIKSVTLADGSTYVPSTNAKYLAISLYNATSDRGMSYAKYQQMFADGFYAELIAK